jgi:hypothetical protein
MKNRMEEPEGRSGQKLTLRRPPEEAKPSEVAGNSGLVELMKKANEVAKLSKPKREIKTIDGALLALNVHPDNVVDHIRPIIVESLKSAGLTPGTDKFRREFNKELVVRKTDYTRFLLSKTTQHSFIRYLRNKQLIPIPRGGSFERISIPTNPLKSRELIKVARSRGILRSHVESVGGIDHHIFEIGASAHNFIFLKALQNAVLLYGPKLAGYGRHVKAS